MEAIEWRAIPDYEGLYEVSNTGEVKSLPKFRKTGRGGYMTKEKILSQSMTTTGYKKVELYKDGVRKSIKVHRLVCSAFLENPENKPFINHKNSIRTDNNLSNLEWCTPSENLYHAVEHGFKNKTQVDKEGLKKLYIVERKTIKQIAKIYNTSTCVIVNRMAEFNIKSRDTGEARIKYDLNIDFLLEELKTKTQKQIAKELGCDPSLISHFVRKHKTRKD